LSPVAMLSELHITDFAIIDRLDLELGGGFNVLTGETGAGKSIIIDAVNALLGSKLGAEFVRSGCEQARVEGVFSVAGGERRPVVLPAEYGIEPDDGVVILSRELHASGRSVCRVNGRLAPVAVLQAVGQCLVDIHGQSEHLSLLRPSQHVDFLDRYGGLMPRRMELAGRVGLLRSVRRDLRSLASDERELARRADLLRYQIDEIQAAALAPDEEGELGRERSRLSNAERILALADAAYAALYQGSDDQRAAADMLGQACAALSELRLLDASLADSATAAEGLTYQVEELARSVRAYRDQVECNPDRLVEVEDRLALIHSLKRKYGSNIRQILAFGERAAAELEAMSHSEERLVELKEQEQSLLAEIGVLASALSKRRQEAGSGLGEAIQREMAGLNMPKVSFVVDIRQTADSDGVLLNGAAGRFAFDATGADKVEFLISPNPGEPPKPLAKIASGGETSRLMLAMKSILSDADATPTLIFDEIDQGVGGRSGHVVGEKLWGLTGAHQVLCVTHLPQIAAFGDTHFSIAKEVRGERTVTRVTRLGDEARVEELAEMLGGRSEEARQAARAMLAETAGRKRAKTANTQSASTKG
jgi:DNA repair protein RecN (Recombination protein N)